MKLTNLNGEEKQFNLFRMMTAHRKFSFNLLKINLNFKN